MIPPTLAQQRGMAFAPIPFAIISIFSSCYVIHYLVFKEREKLKRMYHRLMLAMNIALIPASITFVWGPFAVPEGTPYFPAASGNIQTCTASAFINMVFYGAVPLYYMSLSLQAFLGVKHNFKEVKYRWIEKWIHLGACCIPLGLATIMTATQNFNPNGGGCFISRAPRGCEENPDIECVRGNNVFFVELILGLGMIFLYLIFPPSIMTSMYCLIGKLERRAESSRGMQRIRETARKKMMRNVALQISVYLLSFWFTWIFGLIHTAYQFISGDILYGLLMFANCIAASQGFVFAVAYFMLQIMGKPKIECLSTSVSRSEVTVGDIRLKAESKTIRESDTTAETTDDRRESYVFNIFDGAPDEDSPWARYFDQDDDVTRSNADLRGDAIPTSIADDEIP